ncbi:hypothetical protein QBC36DRAFT_307100 [Triangularia setosa]|uniref:Uncharacterized protein n=1 Tax=Triangularia setosa TaxID=2587417 RepID=A0AAN6WF73_9PEZI|nr:hypothetical protein QBC36DRAFT_307100 [Podospora setosa]
MSRFTGFLVPPLLAVSFSIAIKIPSLKRIWPSNPNACPLILVDAPSRPELHRDEAGDRVSPQSSDLTSIQAEATDIVSQIIQSVSDIVTTASAAVDGAAQLASQAVASASAWVSDAVNVTESDAKDLGNGVHDWFDSDTNGMSNKALLGVVIAAPIVVILAMGWFCCCR